MCDYTEMTVWWPCIVRYQGGQKKKKIKKNLHKFFKGYGLRIKVTVSKLPRCILRYKQGNVSTLQKKKWVKIQTTALYWSTLKISANSANEIPFDEAKTIYEQALVESGHSNNIKYYRKYYNSNEGSSGNKGKKTRSSQGDMGPSAELLSEGLISFFL